MEKESDQYFTPVLPQPIDIALDAIMRVRELHKHIIEHHEAHIYIDDAQWELSSSPHNDNYCDFTYCFNCEKHYDCPGGYQMHGAMYDPDADICNKDCEHTHMCETPKWGCKGWHSERCGGCMDSDGEPYPCRTIKALNGIL